jgi:hypothetical protein
MSVFVVFPKYLTMHVYHILLDAMFDGFRRHVLYECNSAATVYRLQNWTFVVPRKEGGRIVPYRDTSRARRDRRESSELEHQTWVGGC